MNVRIRKVNDKGIVVDEPIDEEGYSEVTNEDLMRANRWIPVGERMPEEIGHYIVCAVIKPIPFPDRKTRDVYECVFSEFGWHTANDVTHWRPLPEPPEVK